MPQQYGSAALLTQYPSYSELLEDYYATKDRAERLRQKSRELYKAVHNMHDRAVRKQAARREELAQSSKADITSALLVSCAGNISGLYTGRISGDRAELLHWRGCHHQAGPALRSQ